MTERYKYGTLIANLLRENITDTELEELDAWICSKPEHMRVFETLINDYKVKWAKKWFADAGVSTKGIKWKKTEGWYRSEEKALRDFFIVMTVMFLVLVGVYFLLEM